MQQRTVGKLELVRIETSTEYARRMMGLAIAGAEFPPEDCQRCGKPTDDGEGGICGECRGDLS